MVESDYVNSVKFEIGKKGGGEMKKNVNFLVLAIAVVSLAVIAKVSSENGNSGATNGDTASAIASQICLDIVPPLEEIPASERYGVLSNALASRGITDFLNTDPDDGFTVGAIQAIFYAITGYSVGGNEEADPSDPKTNYKDVLASIFSLPSDTPLTLKNLQKVLGFFPDCDPGVDPYVAPEVEAFIPGAPRAAPEQSSSKT